jgi:CRISPR system Cascade subunit CasD
MATFLVLRLQGPLMSFGSVSVDETRPTHQLPTQSQLTGLLANALGWRAREGARLNRLQERLVFGARRDIPGELLVDYQNAHIHKGEAAWRARATGPLVRAGGDGYENTQRWRHYIADGAVRAVLTLEPADEEPTLDQVARALERPARPLFLGRVSCPPSFFLHCGETVSADSVPEALLRVPPLGASRDALPAEWPARGALAGELGLARQVLERADLRDWVNNLHTGWRLVATGFLSLASEPGGGQS